MKERYDNLDGLRVISCLCIIAMHIMANADYSLGRVGIRIIGSWTHFVPLFLMISGALLLCLGFWSLFARKKENDTGKEGAGKKGRSDS